MWHCSPKNNQQETQKGSGDVEQFLCADLRCDLHNSSAECGVVTLVTFGCEKNVEKRFGYDILYLVYLLSSYPQYVIGFHPKCAIQCGFLAHQHALLTGFLANNRHRQ